MIPLIHKINIIHPLKTFVISSVILSISGIPRARPKLRTSSLNNSRNGSINLKEKEEGKQNENSI
jgi:hypothetical protein